MSGKSISSKVIWEKCLSVAFEQTNPICYSDAVLSTEKKNPSVLFLCSSSDMKMPSASDETAATAASMHVISSAAAIAYNSNKAASSWSSSVFYSEQSLLAMSRTPCPFIPIRS